MLFAMLQWEPYTLINVYYVLYVCICLPNYSLWIIVPPSLEPPQYRRHNSSCSSPAWIQDSSCIRRNPSWPTLNTNLPRLHKQSFSVQTDISPCLVRARSPFQQVHSTWSYDLLRTNCSDNWARLFQFPSFPMGLQNERLVGLSKWEEWHNAVQSYDRFPPNHIWDNNEQRRKNTSFQWIYADVRGNISTIRKTKCPHWLKSLRGYLLE